ncbi:polymorphic toxin type 44 domain-containing protein [Nocardia sp. AG03]|uniref:polymorphic toxin type 44 domain-containing protein n=1 Tax=Nocardia sp. AG03 TaxID=3025312 RepID=UPI0024187747|nr:polymorphic toxin type 44 domain-containing protein [Nocardia sp. AG03]
MTPATAARQIERVGSVESMVNNIVSRALTEFAGIVSVAAPKMNARNGAESAAIQFIDNPGSPGPGSGESDTDNHPTTADRRRLAEEELQVAIEMKYMGLRHLPGTRISIDDVIERRVKELNKWNQLAKTQMNLSDYSASEQRFNDAESYIFDEMIRNVNSAEVSRMSHLNDHEWWEALSPSTSDEMAAMLAFKGMVEVGAPWDHKPLLADEFNLADKDDFYFKDPSQDRAVYYDIYSNIHYGYVGNAAGFPEDTLMWAANLHDGSTGANDVGDDITMKIGYDLYEKYGKDITREQLRDGIRQAMVEMEMAMSDGETVVQLRTTR